VSTAVVVVCKDTTSWSAAGDLSADSTMATVLTVLNGDSVSRSSNNDGLSASDE